MSETAPETIGVAPIVTWAMAGSMPRSMICPNCAAEGMKPLVLDVDVKPVHLRMLHLRLLRCDACTACFYETPHDPDYRNQDMLKLGRTALHVQQGAGLRQLCRPIFRILKPPGSSYLDVGCGIGFGLDFALHAKGWVGEGIDPGPYAGIGRAELGLTIAPRMLGLDEPAMARTYDVVMSAETIEHVPSPLQFLRTLAAVLKPDGVLALTTPDAGALRRELAQVQLAGLLSPSQHVILQSRASLKMLLAQAGFSHIRIDQDGACLLAYASCAPLRIEGDEAQFSASFLDYLLGRAADPRLGRDMALGFAGRAVLEAANAGDFAAVERLRPVMDGLCARYFGMAMADVAALAGRVAGCSLERMAELVPLNLAGVLYGYAMSALAAGQSRAEVMGLFEAASQLAGALQRAARALVLGDGLSEDLAWVAAAEALLCRAEMQVADFIAEVAALPAAPGGNGVARRREFVERIFVTLVNHAKFADAAALRGAEPVGDDRATLLFAHAVVDLNFAGEVAQAQARFARAVALAGDDAGLRTCALQGEAQAAARLACQAL